MMLHSFQDNAGISFNGSSKNMLVHALLSLLVSKHGFIQILFGIFKFFCFCFISTRYFLILLNFTIYLFSVNTIIYWLFIHHFFIDEKRTQWNLNTWKYFMTVFHVSSNAPEIVFHEMLWKKSFTVYPCIKSEIRIWWYFHCVNYREMFVIFILQLFVKY